MLTATIFSALIATTASVPSDISPKAQVQEAVALADGMKTATAYFASRSGRFPASNEEADLPAPELVRGRYVASGTVTGSRISFAFGPGADKSLVSKHLTFEGTLRLDGDRAGSVTWACKSDDIAQQSCPDSCACLSSPVQHGK